MLLFICFLLLLFLFSSAFALFLTVGCRFLVKKYLDLIWNIHDKPNIHGYRIFFKIKK